MYWKTLQVVDPESEDIGARLILNLEISILTHNLSYIASVAIERAYALSCHYSFESNLCLRLPCIYKFHNNSCVLRL